MSRITDSQYHQLLDDLGRVRAENHLLADENARLAAANDLLAAHVPGLEEGNRMLQARIVVLEGRIEELLRDAHNHEIELARRDEHLQGLSDLAVEETLTAKSKYHYLAQVLVAIAHYGGSDASVPTDLAYAAVKDFLPEPNTGQGQTGEIYGSERETSPYAR